MQSAPSIDTRTAADSRPARAARGRLVTDAPMRMFHWLFALSFVGAYFTAESEHWRLLHVTLGYAFAGGGRFATSLSEMVSSSSW